MKKIPARYYNLVFAFLMATFMDFMLSFIMVMLNIGFTPNFFFIWAKSFCASWIVAFPVALFVSPKVRKITSKLVSSS